MEIVYEHRVPYADVDQMSIVYYANYLIYFEHGRNEYLRKIGLPYYDMEKMGIMLPVLEAHCNYYKSAKYDDLLYIKSELSEINGPRLKMSCQVCLADGTVLAEGYTWHVSVSIETGKPCRLPQNLKLALEKFVVIKK